MPNHQPPPHRDCPAWCVAEHPGERIHHSRVRTVPVLSLRRAEPEAGEADVALLRIPGRPDTWLSLSLGDERVIELSIESAVRLLPALRSCLRQLSRPGPGFPAGP